MNSGLGSASDHILLRGISYWWRVPAALLAMVEAVQHSQYLESPLLRGLGSERMMYR
jgi:hypothetical protein